MKSLFVAVMVTLGPFVSSSALNAERSSAYLDPLEDRGDGSGALDVKGRRERASDYPEFGPWISDRVKAVAPDYPYTGRLHRYEGTGLYQLVLDLGTGSVSKVVVMKSTGFKTLDDSAVAALRQWRWRPGTWKEIDVPVTFKLENMLPSLQQALGAFNKGDYNKAIAICNKAISLNPRDVRAYGYRAMAYAD